MGKQKCKAVRYIDQSDNSSWRVLGFDTYIFNRFIADWSVENMNPNVTPYGMSLYVSSVSPKKIRRKYDTTNF